MSNKQRISLMIVMVAAAAALVVFILMLNHAEPNQPTPLQPLISSDSSNPSNSLNSPNTEAGSNSSDATPVPLPVPEPEPAPYTTTATLTAVGDIMMHSPQLSAAYDAKTDTYSFDSYFTEVKSYLQGDWVTANLETPLAGKDLTYSGYPMFNSPDTLADTLKDAGFTIITTANNHSLDRRETGVLRTIYQLQKRGLAFTGTASSAQSAEQTLLVDKNEISMAFLAYTYGTNGIPIPEGKPYLVNLIDVNQIIADIHKAKAQKADIVTIALHFGNEYQRKPNEAQRLLAKQLIAAGADIILGSHPHVVQPYEWITVSDGEERERQGIVIYSLGNFISNQSPSVGTAKYTDVGVIFSIDVEKSHPDGATTLKNIRTIPTWVNKYTENNKKVYRVLPIEDVLAHRDDPILTSAQYELLDSYALEMAKHLQPLTVPVDTLPNK